MGGQFMPYESPVTGRTTSELAKGTGTLLSGVPGQARIGRWIRIGIGVRGRVGLDLGHEAVGQDQP
jgi:hypothetical protein